MNQLLVHYRVDVYYPEVSGAEHLEILQIRDRLAELESALTSEEQTARAGEANWTVADGVVQADQKVGEGSAFLVSKDAYTDFELRVEFWVDPAANSGIFIRCTDPHKITATTAYEVHISDRRPDPRYGTGAIVNVAEVDPMPKAGGQWNTFEITAKGPQLTVVLNGTQTVDIHDSQFASGPLALQYGSGVVKFRTVAIRPL